VSVRRTSPSVLAAQERLSAAFADRPVIPCAELRVSNADRGAYAAARRRLGVEIVRDEHGTPCYSLPESQTPPRPSS
jgi:hypothetical protein